MNRPVTSTPRILGIDPGLASTGVGVIEQRPDGAWRLLESRDVRTSPGTPLPRRLKQINDLVSEIVSAHNPGAAAVESIFFAKNVRSAILMAHGRGAAILALENARVPVHEYSPLEIKQSVVGKGRASKAQVMHLVRVLLGLKEPVATDHQADALACALAHAYRSRLQLAVSATHARRGESEAEDAADEAVSPAKLLLAEAMKSRRRRR